MAPYVLWVALQKAYRGSVRRPDALLDMDAATMTSVRFVVASKSYHPDAGLLARCRAFYWAIIRRYETELCGLCGRPVGVVYHVPDELWRRSSGFPTPEAGVLCVSCIDERIWKTASAFPRWTCQLDDSVMRG